MGKITGKPGAWYQDEQIGGYFAADGHLIVCEEYGVSDADCDRNFAEVQNGQGYYDNNGSYRHFGEEE